MGGIDGGFHWEYERYSYRQDNTCPECGGTGKENKTLDCKCWRCGGLGSIKTGVDNEK